jgi:hypothetical protein
MSLEERQCPCVQDWRRSFLKFWYVLALVLALIAKDLPKRLMAPLGFVGLFAFGTLLSTLWTVESQKCRCAQDWREKVLLVTSALAVFGIFFIKSK